MPLHYDPPAGCHIVAACDHATKEAERTGDTVEFAFNGVEMVVRPGERTEDVAARWQGRSEERAAAYRASEEGRMRAREDAELAVKAKLAASILLDGLPAVLAIGNPDDLLRWLDRFTDVADHVAVRFDKAALADRLEAAGYVENAHVTERVSYAAGSVTGCRTNGADFSDPRVLREYIVGQAINCLRNGMPPHPMTREFIKRYADLTGGYGVAP